MDWLEKKHAPLSSDLQFYFGDSRILAQQLADRGLIEKGQFTQFLEPQSYPQASPFDFQDMPICVERIQHAISHHQRIGVWGDFDVDGQTSTALLVDGLRHYGADTCFHIPIRATESHGIELATFKSFLETSHPDLIITCDTGISDHESIQFASQNNLDVILTDHHKLPAQLPPALGIINPHLLAPGHPLSYLAGVGSAFQLLRALDERMPGKLDISRFYDLVALGTVADLAELKAENRFYAQVGLRQMNNSLRPALHAILQVSSARVNNISETTIGFTIAPRLNAAGRLSDANPNVDFLLSTDEVACMEIARSLESLNVERKLSVENVLFSAGEIIKQDPALTQQPVIILHHPRWQGGVLGIAAGKLAQDFNRPAILLREENGYLSGSARSVEGIDITAAIAEHQHLLTNFGGHAMAGGLRMLPENYSRFASGLNTTVAQRAKEIELPVLEIDHFLSFSHIDQRLLQELEKLAPFGPGNPKPVIASRRLTLIQSRKFGNNEQFVKITAQDINGDTREVTSWAAIPDYKKDDRVDIAYHIVPDDFRGNGAIDLEYIDARPTAEDGKNTPDIFESHIEIIDFRNVIDPIQTLHHAIENYPTVRVWYEGPYSPQVRTQLRSRLELSPSHSLALLVPPANIQLLNDLVQMVSPHQLMLFSFNQPDLSLKTLLELIGSVIKTQLDHNQKNFSPIRIASGLNITPLTARLALDWYQAHGDVIISNASDDLVQIERCKMPPNTNEILSIQQNLNKILKEHAAFRGYYQRVDAKLLLRK